jgi:hypothetical protein
MDLSIISTRRIRFLSYRKSSIFTNLVLMAESYSGRFVEYLLERADVAEAWKRHTEHEFIARLADGTLPVEVFKYYLVQDYLYLIQFARANALAGYKAKTIEDISAVSLSAGMSWHF